MAYQTQPAYIVTCSGWEERIKEHPVFDWMVLLPFPPAISLPNSQLTCKYSPTTK
jgi:hypothetical protein